MTTFNDLNLDDNLLKAIEKLGFVEPTPVQAKVIPKLLTSEKDLVGLAQTGTGKTAAFGLPLLQITDTSQSTIQALILSPTRELCIQIARDLTDYAKYIKGLKVLSVYGGSSIMDQIRSLSKGIHVVVATPGRLNDLIRRGKIRLENTKRVVLDEADEMLNMGFQDELELILEKVPEDAQKLLFSATMPTEITSMAKHYMKNAEIITLGKRNSGAENVNHIYHMVHAKDRYKALKHIADFYPDMYAIVFCRTRLETQSTASSLIQDGYNADSLHGDLTQAQRDSVMRSFRNKTLQILVATDVAARGLDVNDLTHIVNYNLPDDIENYTHRSGRTGRAGKKGTSIVIINMREKYRIFRIEKMLKKEFEYKKLPSGKEICEAQLFSLINKMKNVTVEHKEIKDFLPSIYKNFEGMTTEEIIQKFVSLEFNRFLAYYKNHEDINASEKAGKRDNSRDRANDSPIRKSSGTTVSINFGKVDGMMPKVLIMMINRVTKGERINIGHIELLPKKTIFELEKSDAEMVINNLSGSSFNGQDVVASIEVGGGGSRGGGSRNSRSGGNSRGGRSGGSSRGGRSGGDSRGSRGSGYKGSRSESGSRGGKSRDYSGKSNSGDSRNQKRDSTGSFSSRKPKYKDKNKSEGASSYDSKDTKPKKNKKPKKKKSED